MLTTNFAPPATPSPSASPRPLSKVRTSFVAIEKDGRIGLRREPSRDSVSVSSRRLSDETDSTAPQPISERSDVFSDNMASTVASFKTNLSHEAIPESPSQDIPAKVSSKKELKSPPLVPNANPDKRIDEEESRTKMLSSDTTASSAARLGGPILNGGAGDALNGTSSTATKAKAPTATKATSKTVAPVSTAKTTARGPKSPMASKAPNSKEPSKPASSSTNPKKAISTKTTASKPAPIELPPSGTGFVKPKPKSPTRPVKLPSSLTTHTASSAQKHGNSNAAPTGRQSLSRASGNLHNLSVNPTTHRSPSRNSVSTIGTTTTKTLKHKPSSANVGRSRPSLGPPPKPVAKDHVPAKRESQVDESFLARMMRPTESSAKKTSEKAPATPPRKRSAPIKKPDTKEAEKNVKKAVAKAPSSSTQPKTAKSSAKSVIAKEATPAAAQAETTDAVIEEAKPSTDVAETPLVEDNRENAEPAVEDVAQEKVVEDNIETTETSTDAAVTTDALPAEKPEIVEVQATPDPVASAEVDVAELVEPVPAVSEDPLKVEDIEDTVQEVLEVQVVNQEPQPTEPAAEVPRPGNTNAEESVAVLAEEPKVDIEKTIDEPPMQEEVEADGKETVSEEVKAESPVTPTRSPDETAQDLLEEAIIKDATAAAL
ncbi:hypothetical protein O1611_g8755 [Lasiodiplodia mahajangana]|uniref:Uncharacterized protein n=1 Tax=Lasiodiplodia mahajangana TaxID=1108764 RepID=A0ACC2JBV3_9PEZI|nr:hypothetical protein O1611_g8755 [Lasiodiplodia mahajangana]